MLEQPERNYQCKIMNLFFCLEDDGLPFLSQSYFLINA